VGSGISGASAAWALCRDNDVTLYEAEKRAGGHTATVDVDYLGRPISVDTGFIVYNELNYPLLTQLFAHLEIETHPSSMGLSLSLDGGRLEWCGHNLATIFAQRRNLIRPSFLWMLREILRFNRLCTIDRDNGTIGNATIGEYLDARGFSVGFRENYLVPMAAAIWSTPRLKMLDYPAANLICFLENHRLIHTDRPQWRTVRGGARTYLDRLLAPLEGHIHLASPVRAMRRDDDGVTLWAGDEPPQRFDEVIFAGHSDQALVALSDADDLEKRILGAIGYRANRVVLHRDPRLMPRRAGVWAAWNYLRSSSAGEDADVSVTYWMNRLQDIDASMPLFVSLNPIVEPSEELVFGEWSYSHPQFDAAALSARARLDDIQGVRRTWFAGAWTGNGFHEDGLRSGLAAAKALGARLPWQEAEPVLPIAAE